MCCPATGMSATPPPRRFHDLAAISVKVGIHICALLSPMSTTRNPVPLTTVHRCTWFCRDSREGREVAFRAAPVEESRPDANGPGLRAARRPCRSGVEDRGHHDDAEHDARREPDRDDGALKRSSVRATRIGCSKRWKLSAASTVAITHEIANNAIGVGLRPCAAITMTGQCQRYTPYEIRPR